MINLRIDIALFQLSIHSNMSLTFMFTVLAACYFPAVDLSDGDYELDLTDFETYYTLANVNSVNKFYFDNEEISFSKDRTNCTILSDTRSAKFYVLATRRVRKMKSPRW